MRIETWFACRRPNPAARLRLLCFPYAGGGVSVFRAWPDYLSDEIEVWAIQLPARDSRMHEPLPESVQALARAVADGLSQLLEAPYACFGHSMGALLAFEFAREQRRQGRAGPAHLLASACRAPQLEQAETPLHTLPDDAFIECVRQRYNGLPDAVLAEPELLQLFLPILRGDFRLVETYQYQHEAPLDCPITAFGGRQDEGAPPDDLAAWRAQTRGAFEQHLFPGGHFYLQTHLTPLLEAIAHALRA